MNRLLLLLSAALLGILTFIACKKETIKNETTPTGATNVLAAQAPPDSLDYADCPAILAAVYKSNGMLVFQDSVHFDECAMCLEYNYEIYNDNYDAQYPNASSEELDSLDIINSFDHWQPYIDFEMGLAFNSLRAKIEDESNLWLDSTHADSIDFDDDPDLNTPVYKESERALLNENGFAKIGTTIISEDDWEEDASMVWDDCGFYQASSTTFDVDDSPVLSNRQIRVKIGVKSGVIFSGLWGKVAHWKRKGNKWKKRRAKLKIRIGGPALDGNCEATSESWYKSKGFKNRRGLNVNKNLWLGWREALVNENSPRWVGERCVAYTFYINENNYFPLALQRGPVD